MGAKGGGYRGIAWGERSGGYGEAVGAKGGVYRGIAWTVQHARDLVDVGAGWVALADVVRRSLDCNTSRGH